MFASLARRILPFLKIIAPKLMRTGTDLIDDVSKGTRLKDAAFKRMPETLSNLVSAACAQLRTRLRRKRTKKCKSRCKRRKRDIFS